MSPSPHPRPVRPAAWVVVAVVAALGVLPGCAALDAGPGDAPPRSAAAPSTSGEPDPAEPSTTAPSTSEEPPAPAAPDDPDGAGPTGALAALDALEVKGRAPLTGYDRAAYGQAWLDADRNGCDTRNDVLGAQLQAVEVAPGTNGCKVLTGLLEDPYTGTAIPYDVSSGDGSGIDVDHVVALGNSWVTGASGWDVPRLAAFANDPLNLLAVDAGANRAKGAGDAATWLPPQRRAWCVYVARQVAVKSKYALWVTPAEDEALRRVLGSCPGQPLPPPSGAPTEVSFLADDGARPSCADLAARGLTPLRRGDPDYDPGLDGDGDGVACE